MNVIVDNFGLLMRGAGATIGINVIGFTSGALLGIILAFVEIESPPAGKWATRIYVEWIRNTPFLLQAMLFFAFLAVFRIRVSPLIPGIAVLAFYTSGYMIEIVRGGLASLSEGQWEASAALGLSRWATIRFVVFPQLLPFTLPASVNLAATAVKESSVLAAVAVSELTYQGQLVIGRTFAAFEVWIAVGLMYLSIVLSIVSLAKFAEIRFNRWGTSR